MGSPEVHLSHKEGHKDRIHRSVRVFCVAPKRIEQLEGELSAGTPIDQVSLVEVVLARKNNSKLVTALGGQLENGEDLYQASQRLVAAKSLLKRESQRELSDHVGSGYPISYVRSDGVRCEAFLTVMPVRSATISLHEPRENKAEKKVYEITELVHVSPRELATIFSTGLLTTRGDDLHMFGHLTKAEVPDVTLSEKARFVQNGEMARVLDEITTYEYEFKRKMVDVINRIRRMHHKPKVTMLGECGKSEIMRGYILAKWTMGMEDNRRRDEEKSLIPTKTNDLPTSALFLSQFPPEYLSDAFMVAPTHEIRKHRNAVFHALQNTVKSLYGKMGLDFKEASVGRTDNLNPMDVVTALRYVWSQVLDLPHERVTELLREMDETFLRFLSEHYKTSYTVVRRALAIIPEIGPYLASELRGVKKDIFQEYFPPNEVASAMERPFFQMLYIFGLHPYQQSTPYEENEAMRRIRGEIFMQVAIQLSAIPAVEKQLEADNSLFEKVLSAFLKFPPELDTLKLRNTPHTIMRRETKCDVDGKPVELWYDKRMVKTILRMWLKSFQEGNIFDVFSHNFVIRDSNFFEEDKHDIPKRLEKSTQFRDTLLTHFREELAPYGWEVSIVPGTHKTGVIDTTQKIVSVSTAEARKKLIEATVYKRRSGSIANTIIREKFVLALTKNGKVHYTEICIYPIERANADGSPLYKSGLIGFVEKLLDDMSGNYNGYRLINPDKNDPTSPSTIEVIRPPVWYGPAYDDIWLKQHKPKAKRKRT